MIIQPYSGFKIAKNTIKINIIVGISLIILKYLELNEFWSFKNALKHDPR